MNTKLHAVTDRNGRPIRFFMTAGQISDYTGTAALLDDLPAAKWLLDDRSYDTDWFRDGLEEEGSAPVFQHDVRELRQMPDRLLFRRLPRRYRYVLATSPEPNAVLLKLSPVASIIHLLLESGLHPLGHVCNTDEA